MRDKSNLTNIDNSDLVKYPNGRIKNNTGAGDGTPVNEVVYGDLHEFKDKLLRLYNISHNGLPDNESNGYQLVDALIALASKNDFILPLSESNGVLNVPLKLSKLKDDESFILKSSVDITVETDIKGTLDNTTKAITVLGSFKANEYIRMINTPASIILIRMVDSFNLDSIVNEFNYLKAATQVEEDAGAIDTVSTTPLTNIIAFAKRIVGVDSDAYLATPLHNGLLSVADKLKLDLLAGGINRYGTVTIGDVDSGSIGFNHPVSGDIQTAIITQITNNGRVVEVTLSQAMQDVDYTVKQHVESLGNIETDNEVKPMIFKKISTTKFNIYTEETIGDTQNIKVHLDIIQR